jgi:hypothetical protein
VLRKKRYAGMKILGQCDKQCGLLFRKRHGWREIAADVHELEVPKSWRTSPQVGAMISSKILCYSYRYFFLRTHTPLENRLRGATNQLDKKCDKTSG